MSMPAAAVPRHGTCRRIDSLSVVESVRLLRLVERYVVLESTTHPGAGFKLFQRTPFFVMYWHAEQDVFKVTFESSARITEALLAAVGECLGLSETDEEDTTDEDEDEDETDADDTVQISTLRYRANASKARTHEHVS
jgi:hypothetical protein